MPEPQLLRQSMLGRSMSDDGNPYQPPACHEKSASWWDWLRNLFLTKTTGFEQGKIFIRRGIGFFVSPENDDVLFAVSPSSDASDARLEFIVTEVQRALADFLIEDPELVAFLEGRRLVLRIVPTYADAKTDAVRQCHLDGRIRGGVLIDEAVAPPERV